MEGATGNGKSTARATEGSGSKRKGAASPVDSLPPVRRVGEGKTPPSESAEQTPPAPSGHPPHKGEGKSLFAKPTIDDMGPGTDMTRPARKPSTFRKPDLDDMGRDIATPARSSLFRKNSLDEMTVGRTEKPLNTRGALPEKPDTAKSTKRFSPLLEGQPERGDVPSPRERGEGARRADEGRDDPRPLIRAKPGAGSYEDAGDAKRQKKTKGKTGRPGR